MKNCSNVVGNKSILYKFTIGIGLMLFAIPAARVHLLARTGALVFAPCAEFSCCKTTCHYLFTFLMVFSSLFATVDTRTNGGERGKKKYTKSRMYLEGKSNICKIEFSLQFGWIVL